MAMKPNRRGDLPRSTAIDQYLAYHVETVKLLLRRGLSMMRIGREANLDTRTLEAIMKNDDYSPTIDTLAMLESTLKRLSRLFLTIDDVNNRTIKHPWPDNVIEKIIEPSEMQYRLWMEAERVRRKKDKVALTPTEKAADVKRRYRERLRLRKIAEGRADSGNETA